MPPLNSTQTSLRIGVDVGGTFTNLVASDGATLHVVKIPSTPPDFHLAVVEAVRLAVRARSMETGVSDTPVDIIHGSTVATHALLQCGDAPVPFVSTEGVGDVPHIGRQNSQDPSAPDELRAAVSAYLESLTSGLASLKSEAQGNGKIEDADAACESSVSLSSRPHVSASSPSFRILNSAGGTLAPGDAARSTAPLVLSGPAGGVIGAAFMAQLAGFSDIITCDMGGTRTDVAMILDGKPPWTTSTEIDGLPMFDIHTVGVGGGSLAALDTGGALRVGPHSAGAIPGPACYNRGGVEPTVTDANLLLGRILPNHFLGGALPVDPQLAHNAISKLAAAIGKTEIETALGIVKVAETKMERAIRAVTRRCGQNPRQFTLVSFGGAGGLHACALADSLDIPRVLIPPYSGVLSALGMIVAAPVADASRTVSHLGDGLDDNRLIAELGSINGLTDDVIPYNETERVEAYADVRFRDQSQEIKIKIDQPTMEHLAARFLEAYRTLYGSVPQEQPIEVVTLHIRRYGHKPPLQLPPLARNIDGVASTTELTGNDGVARQMPVYSRSELMTASPTAGPFLLIDAEATTLVSAGWIATAMENGSVVLRHNARM